jgi:hypothetical protein
MDTELVTLYSGGYTRGCLAIGCGVALMRCDVLAYFSEYG